jgi:hypothetical protein
MQCPNFFNKNGYSEKLQIQCFIRQVYLYFTDVYTNGYLFEMSVECIPCVYLCKRVLASPRTVNLRTIQELRFPHEKICIHVKNFDCWLIRGWTTPRRSVSQDKIEIMIVKLFM